MSREVLEKALLKSGVLSEESAPERRKITKTDMFAFGLSGCKNSKEKRQQLLKKLELPQGLSSNAMLDILNTILTYEEFCEVAEFGKEG